MTCRTAPLLLLCTLLLATAVARAADPGASADRDAACERDAAEVLLEGGDVRAALERLRAAQARFPDEPILALLVARCYLVEGNLFWAERTLREAITRWPDNPQLPAWLACVHLRQGDPQLAGNVLDTPQIPAKGPLRARWRLLQAFRALLEGETDTAAQALAEVPRSAEVYSEDRPVWTLLQRRRDPLWLDPVSVNLRLTAGRTSNALAGAPTDPRGAGARSDVGDIELRARLAPPAGRWRPVLDAELVGHWLDDPAYRELSNLRGGLRLGGLVTGARQRLLLGYRGEVLLIKQDDARYAEAHRAEIELESRSGLVVFAGAGRRSYRNEDRTRWEADVGLGGSLLRRRGTLLVAGATLRAADAVSPAYDQRGASLAAAVQLSLGRGLFGHLAATASWEDYPHSAGLAGLLAFASDERRQDLLGRLTLRLETGPWHGLVPGLEWQLSRRDSTLRNYDFTESRITVLLRFSFTADPWAPRAVQPPGHLPMEWGLGAGEEQRTRQIIDLLRHDEELRRGTSCHL